jgi:hypothetical protein
MADLDAMLDEEEEARPTPDRLDALLAEESEPAAAAPLRTPTEAERAALKDFGKPEARKWWEAPARGFIDPALGAGQIMQRVIPDALLDPARRGVDAVVNAAIGGDFDTSGTTTKSFDKSLAQEEGVYQRGRPEDERDDIDWARIGGTLANPVTWLSPAKGGSTIKEIIKAGAKAGAFQALLQPVNSEGSFIFDKSMQGALGAVFGGTLAGGIAALRPAFSKAREVFGKVFGRAGIREQAAAASQVTDDTLRVAGIEPSQVDPPIYDAMKREVGDALRMGVDPDPTVMTNRADAAALPIPVNLTRGMASRDPFQYSWEVNNSKLVGKGEPIAETIRNANRNLVANLDELGAKNARSTYDFSQQAIAKLQEVDETLSKGVSDAYAAVRNSQGQPALLDHRQFVKQAFNGLKATGTEEFLPEPIRKTLNALQLGNSPLTVSTAQQLDKIWSTAQRATQDGNVKTALGALREALNGAQISEPLGQQSMAAYQAARGLAKQRFELIRDNPALKAVVDGAEPDKFFQKYVEGANVSELGGLKQLLGPDLTKAAQNTAVARLKKAAIGASSDENALFGQAAYNNIIQGDVSGPRLRELFKDAPQVLGNLYRVGRVAENAFKYPGGHSVNTSNTTPASANMIEEALGSAASRNTIGGLVQFGRDYAARKAEEQTIREAAQAGVTKAPLRRPPPSARQARITDLLSRGAGAAAPEDED